MTDTEVTEGPGFKMLITVIFAKRIMKANKRSFILSVINIY